MLVLGCIPFFKIRFSDPRPRLSLESRDLIPPDQVIHGRVVKGKHICDLLHGIGICPQFFSGWRSVHLFALGLVGIPFLKAFDHDPHLSIHHDRLEAVLMYQPVGFRLPEA